MSFLVRLAFFVFSSLVSLCFSPPFLRHGILDHIAHRSLLLQVNTVGFVINSED